MKPASLHRDGRFFALLVLLLFVTAIFIFQIPKAHAYIPECGTAEVRRTYYSDATKTVIVGGWRYTCWCDIETWGTQTGSVSEQWLSCP
jgi:uncharacterized protein DUF6289